MWRRRPEIEAALLGLIHGPAELVPVSSSGHAAALPWLLGWEVAGWPADRRKELEVALHAGTAAALARDLVPARREAALVVIATLPPVLAGWLGERVVEERLGRAGALAAGLLAGSAALVAADLRGGVRRREDAGAVDALWLGLAQAAALVPGVSRTGATLAAARSRGFARPDASRLSFAVAGPVLAGAATLKTVRVAARSGVAGRSLLRGGRAAARGGPAGRGALVAGAGAAFASTLAARRLIGLERRRPLWPWAAERALLAILVLRYGRNR